MLKVLRNRTFRILFIAQIVALLGTGLMTIALALLAYDLAEEGAGRVLGTVLAIKMIAYVVISPLSSALTEGLPVRITLIVLDIVRAVAVIFLPFVTEIWQVYAMVLLLQAASAGYTPAFQAVIPEILPDEGQYTRALSLSRLASDLESALSPLLAALLLVVVSFNTLFLGTALGFLVAALCIGLVVLPKTPPSAPAKFLDRATKGIRIYFKTPRLRGMFALGFAAAAAGSMVLVNTVVLVQDQFGLGEQSVAFALAAYGGGSMAAALSLPRFLDRLRDRTVMLLGAGLLTAACIMGSQLFTYTALLALWVVIGIGFAMTVLPAGRLIRRSANAADRTGLFAAQFAISHSVWLLCYPLAGSIGAAIGVQSTFWIMAAIACTGLLVGLLLWPARDPEQLRHSHSDLDADDPHLIGAKYVHGTYHHSHRYVIDRHHPKWPG
ncbi:MFS transporter [Tropicimonas sp. IMCC34011]|uniref:MFS transporter n=1 Tax=Tropicimonas sp. IMCC34011 TaxID=2248759 RepID=UPI000E2594AA|nr:MFS transporter [Tropicimonas sp. IMCC34011]